MDISGGIVNRTASSSRNQLASMEHKGNAALVCAFYPLSLRIHIYIYVYIYILAPIPRSNLALVHTDSGVLEKVVVVLRFLDIFRLRLLVAYYEWSTSRGDR